MWRWCAAERAVGGRLIEDLRRTGASARMVSWRLADRDLGAAEAGWLLNAAVGLVAQPVWVSEMMSTGVTAMPARELVSPGAVGDEGDASMEVVLEHVWPFRSCFSATGVRTETVVCPASLLTMTGAMTLGGRRLVSSTETGRWMPSPCLKWPTMGVRAYTEDRR
jgi:hypothetical protein